MKTIIRNFSHTFRRFLTASLLNIIGLSIAFASFFVIMTQVDYDYNFNKGYKDYDKIFLLEMHDSNRGGQTAMARPLCDLLKGLSPHIQAISVIDGFSSRNDYEIDGKIFNEIARGGFGCFPETFHPQMVNGSIEALNQPNHVLIPASMAMRFFGTTDAVGKNIFIGKQADGQSITIGGIYKDFPENTQLKNPIFCQLSDNENKDNWSNWNYDCYVRLDSPEHAPEVAELLFHHLTHNNDMFKDAIDEENCFRFIPLKDLHLSAESKGASSRTTVYLLLCVSFLIVIIATVNFMNFSLAETPMRVRSINTQKVMGATTLSLRTSLIIESVLISFIAFVLSLVLLLTLKDSGLQDLVTGNLALSEHPLLFASTFGLSLLMGLLAGIYPSYYVTSFPPALALKGSFGLSPKGRMLRTSLVCLQFIVSFALIIAIGIMFLQSNYIRTTDYGYDKDVIAVGNMTAEAIKQIEAVRGELSGISGVEGVTFSQFILSDADSHMSWGRGPREKNILFQVFPVDYNYLDVMGIQITEGRKFKPGDGDVYIFNEAARKKYPWMKVDQLATTDDLPVIGFCENLRYSTFRNDDTSRPMAFIVYGKAYQSWGAWQQTVNVRIAAGADRIGVIKSLQKTMEKFTPGHDFNFRFMDEVIDRAYHNELRFTRQILLFSLLAIVISIIGVFGLTMFESEYRRKEIGIRKIMGSSTGEILYMFNRRYFSILGGCFLVAAPFGWWIGKHWLEGFAEKTPISPWIFLIAFLLVTLITMLTVTIQSWKNANENPANSIKTE